MLKYNIWVAAKIALEILEYAMRRVRVRQMMSLPLDVS